MNYYLRLAILGDSPVIEITDKEFKLLQSSSQTLNAAFSFEENYDLVIGNYLEFENSALSLTTSSVVRPLREYLEMFEVRAELNRRAVNFLSTAKLFIDQLPQKYRECGGNRDELKKIINNEYDSNFEYRFMEALRNHVQHSGSAVHSLSFSKKRKGPTSDSPILENVLLVHTDKKFLMLDSQFKKNVLAECPEKCETLMASRRYLESLGYIHAFARQSIDINVSTARRAFEDAIQKYEQLSPSNIVGLTAHGQNEAGELVKVPIFLDWDDVRLKLEARNPSLRNLSNSLIANFKS